MLRVPWSLFLAECVAKQLAPLSDTGIVFGGIKRGVYLLVVNAKLFPEITVLRRSPVSGEPFCGQCRIADVRHRCMFLQEIVDSIGNRL